MTRARWAGRSIFACVLGAFLLICPHAHADEAKQSGELAWNPAWSKFRPSEFVLTGVAGAASFAAFFYLQTQSEPHWSGGILFDNAFRRELLLHSESSRDTARTASNWTAISTVVWAVGVDSVLVPLIRNKVDVGVQLALMDAESFALSTLVTTTMFKTVGRTRPSYEDCQRDPNFDRLCRSAPTASFPSGHTNGTFTAAGLGCAHHLHLALYGNTFADTMACAGMITVASATGVLRVMGDRHYTTDVLAGGLIGFAFGYGMPTLFHYGKVGEGTEASLVVSPVGAGFPFGPTISGTF